MMLKEGLVAGKPKIIVKGKGLNVMMPVLGNTLVSPITVQLESTSGVCWEAVYSFPYLKNDGTTFKDKAD
jgi:hypothetical protein